MYKDNFPDEIDEIPSHIFEQLTKRTKPKISKPFITIVPSPTHTEPNWFHGKFLEKEERKKSDERRFGRQDEVI